jgi:hypothetical protein
VDLPPANATAGDVWAAFDGQTGRLDTANTYKRAVIETVEACERRDREAAEKIDGKLTKLLAAPAPSPAPAPAPVPTPTPAPENPPAVSPLTGDARLIASDVLTLKGERTAHIPVQLKEPLRRQASFLCQTRNGPEGPTKAYQDGYFRGTGKTVVFRPGETVQFVDVPLLTDLGGLEFYLDCNWSNNFPAMGTAVYRITGAASRPAAVFPPQPTFTPPAMKAGRSLVWTTDFLGRISANAEPNILRTHPAWGYVQSANQEIAPYVDASLVPGVDPHPIVGGHRVLKVIPKAFVFQGLPWSFAAPMLTTETFPAVTTGYVELRAANDGPGVNAFWLIPANNTWPPELDVFEKNLGGDPRLKTTIHGNPWSQEGVFIEAANDNLPHDFGVDITPAWIVTTIDGVEVSRRPNPWPGQSWQVVVNIGLGGVLGPAPPSPLPAGWKAEMTLYGLAYYR